MKLSWDKDSNAYEAAEKIILKKYGTRGESIVVQLYTKYSNEEKYREFTTLLLNEGDKWFNPEWIWEDDWWEGEQDVILVAAAPIEDIDISESFAI